jgi:hypothetical protein
MLSSSLRTLSIAAQARVHPSATWHPSSEESGGRQRLLHRSKLYNLLLRMSREALKLGPPFYMHGLNSACPS